MEHIVPHSVERGIKIVSHENGMEERIRAVEQSRRQIPSATGGPEDGPDAGDGVEREDIGQGDEDDEEDDPSAEGDQRQVSAAVKVPKKAGRKERYNLIKADGLLLAGILCDRDATTKLFHDAAEALLHVYGGQQLSKVHLAQSCFGLLCKEVLADGRQRQKKQHAGDQPFDGPADPISAKKTGPKTTGRWRHDRVILIS